MNKSPLAVILCNLGTPEAPTASAVRAFLKPFLSDRRVVDMPRPLWWFILNLFILPFRPKKVALAYQALWSEYGDSPLRLTTKQQVEKLNARLDTQSGGGNNILVDYAFTYGEPSLANQLDRYREQVEKIVLLPLYPQYSCSTTAAIYDQVAQYNQVQQEVVDIEIVKDYYRQVSYRAALADSVKDFWQQHGQGDHLLISNHGIPQAYADKGDPYYQQCIATSNNLMQDLDLNDKQVTSSFQSRVGRAEWLNPYTDVIVQELAKQGVKTLDVICPSFSVDCLETLEEIAGENAGYFTAAGGEQLRLIPCLNAKSSHIDMMAEIVKPYIVLAESSKKA